MTFMKATIIYGPPGSGKTTIANGMAEKFKNPASIPTWVFANAIDLAWPRLPIFSISKAWLNEEPGLIIFDEEPDLIIFDECSIEQIPLLLFIFRNGIEIRAGARDKTIYPHILLIVQSSALVELHLEGVEAIKAYN